MYAFLSPVISLIKKLISVITLIRLINFRTNAYIWMAEDEDYIAELVTFEVRVQPRVFISGGLRCSKSDMSGISRCAHCLGLCIGRKDLRTSPGTGQSRQRVCSMKDLMKIARTHRQ